MKKKKSLRGQLFTAVLLCWVLPIIIVLVIGGSLLSRDFERSARNELILAADHALEQCSSRFDDLFEDSKTVSYDGIVRDAYRTYLQDGDSSALYRTVSTYLNQRFSRSRSVRAMFISFPDAENIHPYMSTQPDDRSRTILKRYTEVEPEILTTMADADTRILFMQRDEGLYITRNLVDSAFHPFAAVVILCDNNYLIDPLTSMRFIGNAEVTIDNQYRITDAATSPEFDPNEPIIYSVSTNSNAANHIFRLDAQMRQLNIWEELPDLKLSIFAILFMVVPLMVVLVIVFTRRVTAPVKTLVDATSRIQGGERGYEITEEADSREFQTLYRHFNLMSSEMKKQFEQALREQEALQQAQIKALQSQINPHFLNNTLEVINWEARIAGNQNISNMIEALATMLSAALSRDGRNFIPLKEELEYVNAYLYITKERIGDRFETIIEIDDSLCESSVPRLILQPIVENAVEHDITRRGGGKLILRAYEDVSSMILEAEHTGNLTDEDRIRINHALTNTPVDAAERSHIGIRNISQRLQLLYGGSASFTISETENGTILSRITFPK